MYDISHINSYIHIYTYLYFSDYQYCWISFSYAYWSFTFHVPFFPIDLLDFFLLICRCSFVHSGYQSRTDCKTKCFTIFLFTFSVLVLLELMFIYGVREGSHFFLWIASGPNIIYWIFTIPYDVLKKYQLFYMLTFFICTLACF